jgi:hypothetical protein
MMSNKYKPQRSNIRKRLLLLDHGELITQIKDLYAISDENRRFLESRFAQGQDQVQWALADYKKEIFYCFFGKRGISIGWGYGDAVQEMLNDLESRFEER